MPRKSLSEHKLSMAISATLKAARMKRGLSQTQLATRLKLSRSYISGLESARRACGLHTLRRLAFGLETTAWELLRSAERRLDPQHAIPTLPMGDPGAAESRVLQ